MKPLSILLLLALLAGCAGPFPAAPQLRHVAVRRADSPAFYVDKIWLTHSAEARVIAGYVGRRLTADPADATVEVRVLAADGAELQRATLSLAAAEFRGVRHLAPVAFFRLTLSAPSERIATVEVSAVQRL